MDIGEENCPTCDWMRGPEHRGRGPQSFSSEEAQWFIKWLLPALCEHCKVKFLVMVYEKEIIEQLETQAPR
jgi:hypothetical protein